MRKLIALVALLAALALAGGCAAYNYPKYAQHQATTYTAQAQARGKVADSLAAAAASTDARTRDTATLALLVMALTDKPLAIEAPREGLVEAGLGAALTMVPGVVMADRLAYHLKGANGQTNYTQNVNGNGSSASLNAGIGTATANPATATPTVVKPEVVVVKPEIVNPVVVTNP